MPEDAVFEPILEPDLADVASGHGVRASVAPRLDDSFLLSRAGAAPVGRSAARIATDATARADWRNARIRLLTELNTRLEAAPDDAARERLIAALLRTLEQPADAIRPARVT